MVSSLLILCNILVVYCNILLGASLLTSSQNTPPALIYLPGAYQKGAVCLDGSPPAYSIDPGSGSGENNWIVHLQGGGWCSSLEECQNRSFTEHGSSKYMTAFSFEGFLNNSPSDNPDFYNWNRVHMRYCDGGSFAGNAHSGMQIVANGQTNTLYFRGQRILEAIIDDLLIKGLASANKAILSGDSAGSLAAFFHCNRFQEKLSPQTIVNCLCDSGFFLDIPDLAGSYSFRKFYQHVVTLHEISLLFSECTSRLSLGECFFPQYNLAYIKVPLFIVQTPYDSYQLSVILAPSSSYSNGSWDACKKDLSSCSTSQLSIIQEQLRGNMLKALSLLSESQKWGMFMVSCYHHTEILYNRSWNGRTKINELNLAQAFSLWYFRSELVQEIDCPYPCNPTCTST